MLRGCGPQVVLRMMEEVSNEDLVRVWSKKLAPPLVTLLSAEPEVQYVALRNINLIVQRWPQILSHEVKVGACLGCWGEHSQLINTACV
jgi:AP-1 complex subunit beta-1